MKSPRPYKLPSNSNQKVPNMSIQESQIDMFDLPTESQLLGQATLEANEQAKSMTPEFESATFFPFWKPTGPQSAAVKLGDKSGVVKPKVDFNPSETRMDKVWEDFLAGKRAHDKKNAKPVTEVDAFGSVVLDSFAQKPKPKELVGSIKALKRVATKELSGKAHSKTETLGVAEFVEVSKAANPNRNHLVGIVSPKAAMGKQNIPDLFKGGKPKVNDVSCATTTVLKSFDSKLKASENNVEVKSNAAKPGKGDHTGIVSPKAAMGKQAVPGFLSAGKPKLNDVSGTVTTLNSYDAKLKATPNNVEVKSDAAKPGKGDHTGIVSPKSALNAGKKVFKPIDGFKG